MNKKSLLSPILAIFVCIVIILALPFDVTVKVDGELPVINQAAQQPVTQAATAQAQTTTAAPVQQTPAPDLQPSTDAADTNTAPSADGVMTDTKEIIDKYTLLVNKFKQEKPAYKKKEFQSLPEEFRNLGTAGNVVLEIASGYMVSEEECEELVRAAGSADEIRWDMPIHDSEVGCLLTDYDAVSWAKCEDLGDGTYKISFSLKEEMNAEPTPADTPYIHCNAAISRHASSGETTNHAHLKHQRLKPKPQTPTPRGKSPHQQGAEGACPATRSAARRSFGRVDFKVQSRVQER